jgi:hypothetical protein
VSEGRDLSLTREQIIGLLAELGQELDASGVKAQLFAVGGAAMATSPHLRGLDQADHRPGRAVQPAQSAPSGKRALDLPNGRG